VPAFVRVLMCVWGVACSGGAELLDARSQPDEDATALSDAAVDASLIDPALSTIEVDRAEAVSGVEQVTVTVTVRDPHGMPIPGIAVQLMATGASNIFSQAAATDASGKTSTTWTSTLAELKSVNAVVGGVMINGPVVVFSPGPPAKLAFTDQPTAVIAGAPFSPAVRVEAQDAFGNAVTTTTGYVALTLDANPGATTLRGTTFLELHNGAATFSATRIDVAGMSYSLRARLLSSSLTDAISAFFDVTWGVPAPAYSTIVAVPHSLEANGVDTTVVTFHVANPYGVALAGVSVSIAMSGSNNTLVPMTGTTDFKGDFRATLSSSSAETKIATGTAGTTMVMGSVKFHPPSCTPMLPGRPTIAFDDWSFSVHVADLDGDGARDVVIGKSQHIAVFRGRGDGTFDPPMHTAFNPTGSVNDIDSGDFNGDGKLDLVLSISNSSNLTILLGAGNGQFATTTSVPLQSYAGKIAVADFNLDGKPDVISAIPGAAKLVVHLGVGNGTFTPGGTIGLGAHDFSIIDANNDGKPDVILSGSSSLATALGVGDGTFQAVAHTLLDRGGTLFTGDFNNDAQIDVGIADIRGVLTPFLGDGAGGFVASAGTVYREPGPQAFDAGGGGVHDVDGDGHVDIVVSAAGATSILKGTGTGVFTLHSRYYARAALLAEVTGDAFVDAVGINGHAVEIVAGTGSTSFVAPREIYRSTDWNPRLYETVADFDGNGRLDYVRYRSDPSGAMCVMLTQQDGTIVQAPSSAATNSPYDAAAGDFTGDGKPDVVIVKGAVTGVTLELAVGDGTGALAALTSQAVASPYVTNLVAADLDLDGKQDLVLYRQNEPGIATALSTGSAFGPIQSYSSGKVNSIVVRDISEDGVPDVIVAGGTGFSAAIRVFIGNGTGGLMMPTSYGTNGLTGTIAVGDLTSDGTLDLVFLETDPQAAQRSVFVFPGLAGGAFGAPIVTPNVRLPKLHLYERVHIFDITGDGNDDLVVQSNHGTTVIGGYGDGYVRQHAFHYAVAHQGGASAGATMSPVVIVDHDANTTPDFVFWSSGLYAAPNAGCVP
jgi:adhesin/invasin